MATAANPTRLDRNVYTAAQAAASLTGRSVAAQLSHWARVGSEVEASALLELRQRRLNSEQLLAGRAYDELAADEQALVRATWDEEIDERIAGVDITSVKHDAGQPVIALDDGGNVIRHLPNGTTERL